MGAKCAACSTLRATTTTEWPLTIRDFDSAKPLLHKG